MKSCRKCGRTDPHYHMVRAAWYSPLWWLGVACVPAYLIILIIRNA